MIRPSPEWFPRWPGETCVIIAGGPSVKECDVSTIKGRARCIVINNSWTLAPWADVLYACDGAWWRRHKGAPEFKGLKLTQDKGAANHYGLKLVEETKAKHDIYTKHAGTVGAGGNGGFHAVNLAVQFGCSKIILVGYDMTLANGVHWHGYHPSGLNNPTGSNLERWRERLDNVAKQLKGLGVTVINASSKSALQNYPKMSLADALA